MGVISQKNKSDISYLFKNENKDIRRKNDHMRYLSNPY